MFILTMKYIKTTKRPGDPNHSHPAWDTPTAWPSPSVLAVDWFYLASEGHCVSITCL